MTKHTKQCKNANKSEDKFLLETRTIIISKPVDDKLADRVIKDILILENDNPNKRVLVMINSPGGDVYSGFAIFDMLNLITCPITTLVMGLSASMGSIISLTGDKGRKFALPSARIMIHQPSLSGNMQAPASDIEIRSQQIIKVRHQIAKIYKSVTGKKIDKILKDMDRDNWFSAKEALKYGLIDKVVSSRQELMMDEDNENSEQNNYHDRRRHENDRRTHTDDKDLNKQDERRKYKNDRRTHKDDRRKGGEDRRE
ncbi:MAG: ATP-dependent Clp protease proteolytic subunit [SAR324 cluster bacterium]|nr:ATP-dependent Clp protease proteolytic subunit [SAR324 cluster bacterium]